MKKLADNEELETLAGLMVREYLQRTKKWKAQCFDLEAFITDYLGVTITYESFAEDDPGKIGFMANGRDYLMVSRNGHKEKVLFPENTIVIEKFLLNDDQSARRRFTMAHEAAHVILSRHIPGQTAAAFHSEFDSGQEYNQDDLKRIFSLEENQADRLGAALLMPQYHVGKALKKYNAGQPVMGYEGFIFSQETKIIIQKMADSLGTSYKAFLNRLRDLGLIETRPIGEYMASLGFGGRC